MNVTMFLLANLLCRILNKVNVSFIFGVLLMRILFSNKANIIPENSDKSMSHKISREREEHAFESFTLLEVLLARFLCILSGDYFDLYNFTSTL